MKIAYIFLVLFLSVISCETPNKKVEKVDSTKEKAVIAEEVIEIPKNQRLTKEQQVSAAVFAAPDNVREGAKVYGYDESGEFVVLKEGSNDFICIADNPNKNGFEVVCYHASLEPFMARGRTLNVEGKSRDEKEEIRAFEAASGDLQMPKNTATLHIYYGENGYFNTETEKIENAKYRYVVYIPYATQETTGLSLKPNESSHPWLMFPGKYNAHIMITP